MASLPELPKEILVHLIERDRFCYPNWKKIRGFVSKSHPENEWNTVWHAISLEWIARIKKGLGQEYRVHETKNFLLLTQASDRLLDDASEFYERSRRFILQSFPQIAKDEGYGKNVVFMFDTEDDYYDYILPFYPDGEHSQSSGVFLHNGYGHFAFPTHDFASYRGVFVHEFTHLSLAHLPIPTWLNEALAMQTEDRLAGTAPFEMDEELHELHRNYWNEKTIQTYWSGRSFDTPGDPSRLSYNLSQLLMQKIDQDIRPTQEKLMNFISSSNWKDAGEKASQVHLGIGVGDLVASFLGKGNWVPKPKSWKGKK